MHDVNNMLSNAASKWRAQADNLDRAAAADDARAAQLESVTVVRIEGRANPMPPGLEMGRPERAQAEKGRREAAWLRARAEYADRGQFLLDGTRPPDPYEQALQAACARDGRLLALDPREAQALRNVPLTV